jgi:phospholipid-translocating ATPase
MDGPRAAINVVCIEMEMKKLHMGTMSYGSDSMDEVSHQLAMAFGAEKSM